MSAEEIEKLVEPIDETVEETEEKGAPAEPVQVDEWDEYILANPMPSDETTEDIETVELDITHPRDEL